MRYVFRRPPVSYLVVQTLNRAVLEVFLNHVRIHGRPQLEPLYREHLESLLAHMSRRCWQLRATDVISWLLEFPNQTSVSRMLKVDVVIHFYAFLTRDRVRRNRFAAHVFRIEATRFGPSSLAERYRQCRQLIPRSRRS